MTDSENANSTVLETGPIAAGMTSRRTPMTVGYRTIFRVPHDDAVSVTERNVRSWLSQKLGRAGALDDWDGVSSRVFGSRLSIVVVDLGGSGQTHRRLYRLFDENSGGRFEIALFAASAASGGHIIIQAARDAASTESAIDGVATPNIVRQILGDIQVHDGSTIVSDSPRVVRTADVPELIGSLIDERRTMSLIVASSLTPDVDARWLSVIDQLTRFSVGVATVFVAYADAVDELNRSLPAELRVPAGQVRTFAPGVRLDGSDDGIAHRFLGPATLGRAIRNGRVQGMLPVVHARGPRARLLERGVPADARRTIDLLSRAEVAERRSIEVHRRVAQGTNRVASVQERPPREAKTSGGPDFANMPATQREGGIGPGPKSVDPNRMGPGLTSAPRSDSRSGVTAFADAVRTLISKWLGRSDVTSESIAQLDSFLGGQVAEVTVATEQIDEVLEENEKLRFELDELRAEIDSDDLESAILADENRKLEHENQRLKRRLRDAQIFYVSEDNSLDWGPPADVEELVARLTAGEGHHRAFDRVVFTGKIDSVLEVRRRDPYGKYARDFWDFVHVLHDYAELRASGAFAGNVHMYLTDDTIDGYRCNPQRHAGRESDSVLNNAQMRAERVLTVPPEVDATRLVLMDAHFKPTHRDRFAPRMHYFDDAANTGKIYIGYIGRHLTTDDS